MDESTEADRVIMAFQNAMSHMQDPAIVIQALWADTAHSAHFLSEEVRPGNLLARHLFATIS